MEYAFYKEIKTAAQPGFKGLCPHCKAEVIAKCGSKKIWHWAHSATENCDPWFEPETQWHRDWKNSFGEKYSEIRVEKEQVYHIADVINEEGVVFEFQNSSISAEIIQARENFYGERMVWILNGIGFKNNFQMSDQDFIKNWRFTILDEFETARNYKALEKVLLIEDWKVKLEAVKYFLKQNGFTYLPDSKLYYLSLGKDRNRDLLTHKLYVELRELYEKNKIDEDFKKGEFEWEHPRPSWEESKRPVFVDFGENFLYRVTSNMGRKFGEGVKVSKEKFMKKYLK